MMLQRRLKQLHGVEKRKTFVTDVGLVLREDCSIESVVPLKDDV
jgi:hypothetical protein